MNAEEKVLHFLDVATETVADLEDIVKALGKRGVTEENAECLIAFVPIAFAHVLLSPVGVEFQKGFIIRDCETGESAHGILMDEPIFVAALSVAEKLSHGNESTKRQLLEIASWSAEYAVAHDLASDDGDLANIVLTEPVLCRVPLTHMKKGAGWKAWKFWRAI